MLIFQHEMYYIKLKTHVFIFVFSDVCFGIVLENCCNKGKIYQYKG